MRHAIANAFYWLGSRLDRAVVTFSISGGYEVGDKRKWGTGARETSTFSYHSRAETTVSAHFTPGNYTYCSLNLGDDQSLTVFLTRQSTRHLLEVLTEVDAFYYKHGENTGIGS